MSAKDMNLISDIDKLLSLDIASFKIEGRMKSIHYIATIVSSYKKAIDEYMHNILSLILYCKPAPVATAISIIIIPNAIAVIAIFIIGDDILFLYFLPAIMRFAINNS